jgi:hypothetical protein
MTNLELARLIVNCCEEKGLNRRETTVYELIEELLKKEDQEEGK